jgi:NET1-associated nuclear protein 1 (U3 small nucleolar RNA-associated protein 17)
MILSTSELVPTAYFAGIQAHVIGGPNPDSLVRRLENEGSERPLIPHTPAVINPARPETLLLAVGEIQEIWPTSARNFSAPFLQTFDIASNHSVSRQAITRTNITNKNIAPSAHPISEPVITHIQISHDGTWLATVDEWLLPKHDVEFLGHSGMNLEDEQRRRREVYLKFWQWNKSNESWGLVSRIDAPHTLAFEKYGAGRVLALTADFSSHTFSTLGEDGIVQIWRPRTRKRDGVIVRGGDGEALCNWHCHRQVSLGMVVSDDDVAGYRESMPSHGSLAFSEDSSLLAAAISGNEDGLIHLIDPTNGTVQSSRGLMYRGDLISLAFSAQYLIILSDELRVWNLVLDELNYGITLGDAQNILFLEQKAEMMHLAVDPTSHTFAIALPCSKGWELDEKKYDDTLSHVYSEVAVFDPEKPDPVYMQRLPSIVTALLPAISSPGYIVLDAAAEISTISPKATQTLTSTAKPIVELRLDIRNGSEETPAVDLMQAVDAEADAEIEEESATVPAPDDDDDGPPVVTSHQLSQVLDVGPSFALPPIEELFYAVAGLLSRKPKLKADAIEST